MVNSGSNVCITGNLGILLDVVDIDPIPISVAIKGAPESFNDCITTQGLLPLTLSDRTYYFQPCYFCANLVETIILPSTILASSNVFVQWQQIGHKDPTVPGSIRFSSHDGLASMHFLLSCRDGLYYCDSDIYTVDDTPVHVQCQRAVPTAPLSPRPSHRPPLKITPTTCARQVESEVWTLCFGSPGEHQLNVLPCHVIGTPPLFEYHPFCLINFKEQAYIRKQPAGKSAERIASRGTEFLMDFCFMHASANDYRRPNRDTDCIVTPYDGYCTYLLVVDSAS
jgi:hypothetical protein